MIQLQKILLISPPPTSSSYPFQPFVIFPTAFVNRVIATAVVDQTKAGDNLTGELWVLSKKKLARYDGSFSQYKRAVRKIIMAHQGTTVTDDI